MLQIFRPCKPGSEFLEQNLITIFSHEFLNKFGDSACVFSEIPFMGSKNDNKWQARLDGFFIEGDNGYFLEAKGSNSKEKLFQSIDNDLKRIHSIELLESFNNMVDQRRHVLPTKLYGLVIADSWQHKNCNSSESQHTLWDSNNFPDRYSYLHKITTWTKPTGYYDNYRHHLLGGWTDEIEFK